MPAPYILGILALGLVVVWRRSTAANEHAEEVMQVVAQDESGVRSLIAQGERIAAIKLARKITGLDLKATADLIESLRRGDGRAFPARRPTDQAGSAAASDPEVRRLLAAGDTIAAIKRWRVLTGDSLIDAKRAVERLEERPPAIG